MNPWMTGFKSVFSIVMKFSVVVVVLFIAFVSYNLGAIHNGSDSASESGTSSTTSQNSSAIDANQDGVIYTCSMHPQIKQDESGDCPICGMDLVEEQVSSSGAGSSASGSSTEPLGYACAMNCLPPQEEEGECQICGMEMQPVYGEDSSSDDESSPRRLTMSREAVALADIQTIRVVYSSGIKLIRMAGELAVDPTRRVHISADVGGRIDELYAEFVGDVVNRGQDLVLFYSPELLAVQQEYLQSLGSLRNLESATLERIRTSARQSVDAARERLRLAGLAPEQIDELGKNGTAKVSIPLRAPIGGTVITRHSEEGEYVSRGEHIVTIADLSVVWGEFEAYESDLSWLNVGQKLTFTTTAIPGEVFEGTVAFIDPLVDPMTRTTRVRVNIDNSSGRLKPGMYVSGTAEAVLPEPALIIPHSAPLLTGKRAVVYVQQPDPSKPVFEGREVILGPKTNRGFVVKEGLAEGDVVVTNGAFQIDSALQIIARPSMMNPDGDVSSTEEEIHGRSEASSNAEHAGHTETPEETDSGILTHEQTGHLMPVYLEIQRSLAADDFEKSLEHWNTLQSMWDHAPAYMEEGSSAEEIDDLRILFEDLSNALIAEVQKHGNPMDVSLRRVHCPMAFDWKGADWLQTEPVVNNPYFGDTMLKCGVIEEEFAPHD